MPTTKLCMWTRAAFVLLLLEMAVLAQLVSVLDGKPDALFNGSLWLLCVGILMHTATLILLSVFVIPVMEAAAEIERLKLAELLEAHKAKPKADASQEAKQP